MKLRTVWMTATVVALVSGLYSVTLHSIYGQSSGFPDNLRLNDQYGFLTGQRGLLTTLASVSYEARVAYVTGYMDTTVLEWQGNPKFYGWHCWPHLTNGQWAEVAVSGKSSFMGANITKYCEDHGW